MSIPVGVGLSVNQVETEAHAEGARTNSARRVGPWGLMPNAIVSLAALLATGCGASPTDSANSRSNSIRATENLRDECGDTVNLSLLGSGSAADTRVIRIADVDLYIPADWLARNGLIHPASGRPRINISGGFLDPGIQVGECPGRVHRLTRTGELALSLDSNQVRGLPGDLIGLRIRLSQAMRAGEGRPGLADRGSIGQPDRYGWARIGAGDVFLDTSAEGRNSLNPRYFVNSPTLASSRGGSGSSTFPNRGGHQAIAGVQISYEWSEQALPEPRWRELRAPMSWLVRWLATAPRARPAEIDVSS